MVREMGWVAAHIALGQGNPLNDFVEFAAVEPHTPAVRTVIHFDALTIRHDQADLPTDGAHHRFRSVTLQLQSSWGRLCASMALSASARLSSMRTRTGCVTFAARGAA